MVLFEQHDEWQDDRRYFLPESMARIDAVTATEEVGPALPSEEWDLQARLHRSYFGGDSGLPRRAPPAIKVEAR